MFVKKHWEISEGGVKLTQEAIATKYPKLSVDAIAIQFSDSYQLKTEQTTGDGGITNELLVNFTKNSAKVNGYYEVIVEAIQADTCIPVKNGENKIVNWNNMPDSFATMPPVSFDPAATLEVTASPMVTLTPSAKPEESNVAVTEEPDWEEEGSDSTETAKPENTYKVTEEPVSTPKATDDGKTMESEETDGPIETLEPDLTSDERPRRTSTPKLPTTVEEVYPTKTGDATPIVVWLALFVVSWIGMFAAFTAYRKRR